jgi:hypothetical protein
VPELPPATCCAAYSERASRESRGYAIQQAHHNRFAASARARDFCLLVFVHVAREPADERLVRFNLAFHLGPERTVLHRFADAVEHEPSGLLRHIQIARDFIAADPVLAIRQQPDSGKPLIQSERRVLEDGSNLDAELATVVTHAAFPSTLIGEKMNLFASTDRTLHDPVRPAQSGQEAKANIGVFEVANRVQQGPRRVRFHASNLASEAGLVKYILARIRTPKAAN